MNIAAALPLGFSSRCEVMDMRLQNDIPLEGLCEKLQDTLPTGIRVLNVERVNDGEPALQTQVASAEYEVALKEPMDGSELKRRIAAIIAAESLPRERRGKNYDLRPLIEEISSPLIPLPWGERNQSSSCVSPHKKVQRGDRKKYWICAGNPV